MALFIAKVRRLYDIANVLRSLKLIEKVHVTDQRGRKPAFEWIGPVEFPHIKGIVDATCLFSRIHFWKKSCTFLQSSAVVSFKTKIQCPVLDLERSTSECSSKRTNVLESRASLDNCAKKLFSSPGTKRSFTRHPSLIKLAKSIQDDRRKINSAPSSPFKNSLSE